MAKIVEQATEQIAFTFEPKTIMGQEYIEVSFWVNGECSANSINKVSLSELKQAKLWWMEYRANNAAMYIAMSVDADQHKQKQKHNYYLKNGFTVCKELNALFRCGDRILIFDNRLEDEMD